MQQVQGTKKLAITRQLQKELHVFSINDVQYIKALIKVNPATVDVNHLNNLGIIVNTQAENIWTIQAPLETFQNITSVKGIQAIDIGREMKLLLDATRKDVNVNAVYKGSNLLKSYWGKDVVIGVIDGGFDYTHPTFYDSTTGKCRISSVWNQFYKEDEVGLGIPPPAGYNYGMELTNLDAIIKDIDTSEYRTDAKRFYLSDGTDYTHATHVAGIATGSGWGTKGKYQGIAPKAEIVAVAIGDEEWTPSNIIDGMRYIYNYAASVHKPAVINFSVGNQVGPHDGTSLLCQGFNSLTGEGKIIVGAAGNDGDGILHLSHTFNGMDSVFTLLGYGNEDTLIDHDLIDCWSAANTDFSAKIMVYKSGQKIGETKFIPASLNDIVVDTIYEGADTAFINIATEYLNPNNHRSNIQIDVTTNSIYPSLSFRLTLKGENTQVHAWGSNGFVNPNQQPKHIAGDSLYTIVDSQTAEGIISVGASVAMNKYMNIYNKEQNFEDQIQIGNIIPFSSEGPTVDGRTKPEIVAPGFVISAISSLQSDYGNEPAVAYSSKSPVNGRIYRYSSEAGTSMASPVVTGAVALMLEANPKLNPQKILHILKTTARKDSFTGDLPEAGSNTWGWGKLNIYEAVKFAEVNTKTFEDSRNLFVPFIIYPNPAKDRITVIIPQKLIEKPYTYTIFDQFGRHLTSNKISSHFFSISIADLPKGIYLIKVLGNDRTITNRFVKH